MLNDKIMIDIASNHIYYFDKIIPVIKKDYPFLKVVDIQLSYNESHLSLITVLDVKSNMAGVVFLGSHDAHCWTHDNLNNFLDKSITQYVEALNYVNEMSKTYNITHVSGNSLGGGCAMYVGLDKPNIRALCINASPVDPTFDYIGNNIVHVRTNSDILSRIMIGNKLKNDHGYPGQIVVVNRSFYGIYNFLETLTLSHRGSITYDGLEYSESCLNALPIARYMNLNLLTNNIDMYLPSYATKKQINNAFKQRINNLNQGLNKHYLAYIHENLSLPLISYTNKINPDLKKYLLEDLLDIDSNNISVNQIYKAAESLLNIPISKLADKLPVFNDLEYNDDYHKIRNDLDYNEKCINRIIEISENINSYLLKPSLFKNIDSNTDTYLDFKLSKFNYEYESLFKNINDTLYDEIVVNNKYTKPVFALIDFCIKVTNLKIIRPFYNNPILNNDDLEYIKQQYDPETTIPLVYNACRLDFLEAILNKSLIYQYQVYMNAINEFLYVYLDDLKQIREYTKKFYLKLYHTKIFNSLDDLETLINNLIFYNKHSVFINRI